MLTNNIFDLKRFSLLCKKDLMENGKTMLLRLVMLYAALSIVFCFICYFDCDSVLDGNSKTNLNDVNSYYSFAGFLFCIFGLFLASFTFEGMRSKTKRISYLMTPSTIFEKFFSRFLLVVPIYLIVFLLVFHLADYTRVLLFSAFYSDFKIDPIGLTLLWDSNNVFLFSLSKVTSVLSNLFSVYSLFFFIQSFFALGSSIWYKKVVIKVVASVVAIFALFFVVNGTLIHLLFDSGMDGYFESLNSNDWFPYIRLESTFVSLSFMVFGLVNWVISYYRLKESEIINRL